MTMLFRLFAKCFAGYITLVVALSLLYLFVPPVSTLMLARWAMLKRVEYVPVPLVRISPHLVRTVLRAEDSRFCMHHGVDWHSLEQVVEDAADDGPMRGASTLPMQVSKNLFLWPQQSYIRKALEIPMSMALDALWPKARMLEVYLSIAEWGQGIYGAEAAAQAYFHKPASALNREEAALLAAALPNPRTRNPAHPSSYHVRYAGILMRGANEDVNMDCLR